MPGFELIGKEEQAAVNDVFEQSNGVLFAHGFDALRKGRFRVRELERAFGAYFGGAYVQAVTSGTMAQYVAMKALQIQPGDEVITQAFTFVATAEVILALGAVPVIVDIDDTFNMDPKPLEAAISARTRLIIPVHMLGNPARMEQINSIAAKHNIPVLEDACEALGASYHGKKTGTIGKMGIFSLDFGKTITTGEGGLIVTKDATLFEHAREYHDHGHENAPSLPRGRDTRSFPGLNLRMMELQAAVGLEQLMKLDHIVATNRANKRILKGMLAQCNKIQFRTLTDEEGDLADTLIFSFERRKYADAFVRCLAEAGMGTKNVPDAIDWHFSGTWDHMFSKGSIYHGRNRTAWAKSAELLYRSVALPIMVKRSTGEMQRQAETILKILQTI
jgi:8-amino-3,8-dideoxy-alpha-D-manno-octulosonate transaminase